jgi:acetyltransferase-like isoleucine patch superfamily enzyme
MIISRILQRLAYYSPGGYRIRPMLQKLRGVHIGENVWISQMVYIDEIHPEAITICKNCSIGLRTSIIAHIYWGPRKKSNAYKEVVIEKDVYIGPHCLILPGVHIGEGSVIKGGAVLTRNVPAHTFWGAPESGPLGKATIPLTNAYSYNQFVNGLRPFRRKRNTQEIYGSKVINSP